jgi:hypothetical protein
VRDLADSDDGGRDDASGVVRQLRLGWGVRPVYWQGWALTGLYVLLVLARMLAARHVALLLIALVALTAAYLLVAGLTPGRQFGGAHLPAPDAREPEQGVRSFGVPPETP